MRKIERHVSISIYGILDSIRQLEEHQIEEIKNLFSWLQALTDEEIENYVEYLNLDSEEQDPNDLIEYLQELRDKYLEPCSEEEDEVLEEDGNLIEEKEEFLDDEDEVLIEAIESADLNQKQAYSELDYFID